MTTEDERTARIRTIEEVFHRGNIDALDEITSPDVVYHVPPRPDVKGREAYKQYMAGMMKALSGFRFTMQQYIFEGGGDAVRWTIQGTHTGQFIQFPPSGKHAVWRSVGFFRVEDGLIREHWGIPDLLGLLIQIGVIPPPQAASATGTVEAQVGR